MEASESPSQIIDARREQLAQAILERHYARWPDSRGRWDLARREKSLQDVRYHLLYLSEALSARNPLLFVEYLRWLKVMLASLGISAQAILDNLYATQEVLLEMLPPASHAALQEIFGLGLGQFPAMPAETPSFLPPGAPLSGLAQAYLHSLLNADRHTASRLVMDEVEAHDNVREVYLHVFQPVQREVGRLWQTNQIGVAQEHFISAATQMIMSQLYPRIFASRKNGRILVAASIGSDLHEIGVRMVADFFEMDHWDTYYLGANIPCDALLQALEERRADVVALSCTMMFHIRTLRQQIEAIRSRPRFDGLRILVGGYPFLFIPGLWQEVGADGTGADALQAISALSLPFTSPETANCLVGNAR